MRRVEVEHHFSHPVDRVFARYTDHVGWSEWAGVGRVRLTREGSPDRNGVGCVRAFSMCPGLREEVIRYEPPVPLSPAHPDPPYPPAQPARMEYRVVKGPVPMADHHGEVLFAPEGSGARVTWRVSFRSTIPGLGWVTERGLSLLFARMLAALARDLDRR